jgi:hypothetical protein
MKEDFSELVQYLAGKFYNIDKKFEIIDQGSLNLEEKIDNKADKLDVENPLNTVNAYAKKADTLFQEIVELAHKIGCR